MNGIEAALVVVVPLLPLFIPGVFFVRITTMGEFWSKVARLMLWSMVINTLVTMIGLFVGVAVEYSFLATAVVSFCIAVGMKYLPVHRPLIARSLFAVVIVVCIGLLFAVPFLRIHNGLPTGDVQKTILFAQQSVATHHLPDYAQSFALLNRDPVDFYTPGLHALSALVLRLSPASLISIGMFSIFVSIAVALIAAAITSELFATRKYAYLPIVSMFLLLTEFRFLRYLREPGYHYQNIFGELYVFGMMLLFLSFIRHRKLQDAILFFACAIALFFSHQFSAFIAAWAFLFGVLSLAVVYSHAIIHTVKTHAGVSIVTVLAVCGAGASMFALGLIKKIPAIFTLHPHLSGLLPAITDYPSTLGAIWFVGGILGVVLLCIDARRFGHKRAEILAFATCAAAILVLSQGPAIGIDIPPIRALFYSAVPLSIAGAYFFYRIGSRSKVFFIGVVIMVAIAGGSSLQRAYASLSHTVRTNSTLSGEQQAMIDRIAHDHQQGGILIDDFNRRAASWLVLSGHPMMTRIAADLQTQMNEARQSQVRNDLYKNQLDYEKIFALGGMPIIANLMHQHQLQFVTGIEGSSQYAFAHNPLLEQYGMFDDATVFQITKQAAPACEVGSVCDFLLRPTTLANDIGDDEDTFEHLEASIRTARLSGPVAREHMTYRETTAQYIPLEFNVADYVDTLWDPKRIGRIEGSLRFMVSVAQPVSGLELQTSSGAHIPLQRETTNTVILTPDMVSIDSRGFITLTIVNSNQQRVGIDLIALGL